MWRGVRSKVLIVEGLFLEMRLHVVVSWVLCLSLASTARGELEESQVAPRDSVRHVVPIHENLPALNRAMHVRDFLARKAGRPHWWSVSSYRDLSTAPTPMGYGGSRKNVSTSHIDGHLVVIKYARSDGSAHYDAVAKEVVYLEYLRGFDGVPTLYGAWSRTRGPRTSLRGLHCHFNSSFESDHDVSPFETHDTF